MPILNIHAIKAISISPPFDIGPTQEIADFLGKQSEFANTLLKSTGNPDGGKVGEILKTGAEIGEKLSDLLGAMNKLFNGPDQLYLSLSNNERDKKIWPPNDDYREFENGTVNTDVNVSIPFDRVIAVNLWEHDSGPSDDDRLGTLMVDESQSGKTQGVYVGNPSENSLYFIVYSVGGTGSTSQALTASAKTLVSAIARTSETLDLFFTGNDSRVYTNWWRNGSDWAGINGNLRAIGGFFPVGAPVSAVARTPETLDLFVVGNDGRVYTNWWRNGSDWAGINDNWRAID